jgi:hypothetical protein
MFRIGVGLGEAGGFPPSNFLISAFGLPSFLQRSLHLGLVERSWYFADIIGTGGLAGLLLRAL